MKIALFAGTRPEAIKIAPVFMALKEQPGVELVLVSSGQHKEMLAQAFANFGLEPGVDLAVMRRGQSLARLSARLFVKIDGFLEREKPDIVLAQGDTTTVMAVSVCAFYKGIAMGHIEAGLRTHNIQSPFPEEFNRRVAALSAKWHFAPTGAARGNLAAEGVPPSDIFVTGNTGIDALLWMKKHGGAGAHLLPGPVREYLGRGLRMILVTAHRRENYGPGFAALCRALERLAAAYPDVFIVYPLHPNPQAGKYAREALRGRERIVLLPPAEYKTFIALMDAACLILTDSGGIQEEGPALGKPVLVTRESTERPEGVEAGTACLVGANESRIVAKASALLDNPEEYKAMAQAVNPYGDGHAAERIRDIILFGASRPGGENLANTRPGGDSGRA